MKRHGNERAIFWQILTTDSFQQKITKGMSLKSSTKIKQQQQQRKKGVSDNKVSKQNNFSVVVKNVTSKITKKKQLRIQMETQRGPRSVGQEVSKFIASAKKFFCDR